MTYSLHADRRDVAHPWVEDVPDSWQFERLKYVASVMPSNVDKLSRDDEQVVRLCNYVDVYNNDEITADLDLMQATATDEQIKRFGLRAGDVIVTKDSEDPSDIAIPAFVPARLDGVVCGYHLAILRTNGRMDGAFLRYLFHARYIRSETQVRSNGLTRYGLGSHALKNLPLVLPCLDEQRAIADFLDRETAKIDTLMKSQQRILSLAEERRRASVDHLVLRGLRAHDLRECATPGFELAPSHWSVLRLRRLLRRVERAVKVDPNQTYREIGIRSWGRGVFHKEPVPGKWLGDKRVFGVVPGALAVNIVFAWEGAVALVSSDEDGMIASHRFPRSRPHCCGNSLT